MPVEPCAAVEARLVEALLARREPDPADLKHARECVACGAARDELRALRLALDAQPAPEPSLALASAAWRSAARELQAAPAVPEALPRGVPEGFARELVRLLAVALAPLPLVVLWNGALLALGDRLLAGLVPAPLLSALAAAYVLSAAAWLSLLYGSLPFVAQRRAERRGEEDLA